ncbi:MAG: long-chain fatty acid--CoA ligase [Gemmataceae bacterium]|nr:long-chain fatty acid--CoA ligase [Gemmataceae bacterium]MDW8264620.1 long-chain fatty acid--CoA ligase [Gemmataceae bacterium]
MSATIPMLARHLGELFLRQAERYGPRVAVRYRRHGWYYDLRWRDYQDEATAAAAGLIDAGVQLGDRVGLVSENRVEWLVADVAILLAGAVNVPPHAPLTARQIEFQVRDAGVSWLFVSTAEQLAKVRQVRPELPALRGVVAFDLEESVADATSWRSFVQAGRRRRAGLANEFARRHALLGRESLATIMYTSGTTGQPKGVMLSHGNLLSNVECVLATLPHSADEIQFSWLPYSHIYARTMDHYRSLAAGNVLALAESPETLLADLRDAEPTHMNGVPRFYEKVLAACAAATPAETGARLRQVFGRRIHYLMAGGAPLPDPVAEAYRSAGLLLVQGYGLTETAPVLSFGYPGCYKQGTVGRPLRGVDIRIASDGEILARGPNVMLGYWNNPAATAEVLRDGWFHTGDLGQLDADGFLRITGRKKELLVLSSGKKVVPAFLEGLLLSDPCIDQCVIAGEGRSYLTALIVPNWAQLRRQLPGLPAGLSEDELSQHPAVQALLRQRIDAALRDVASWEQVKAFAILPRPLTVAGDELTVSLKLRRNVVLTKYAELVERLYQGESALVHQR